MLSGMGNPSVLGSSWSVSARRAVSEGSSGRSWTKRAANETGCDASVPAGFASPARGTGVVGYESAAMGILRVGAWARRRASRRSRSHGSTPPPLGVPEPRGGTSPGEA